MNIDNIVVGQRVPNYRKLCEIMEESVFGGTQKVAQLKRWEQFFSWEKAGNAYVIKEIYEAPKESSDGRRKYLNDMEPIILHHLGVNGMRLEGTTRSICEDLGIVQERAYNEREVDNWVWPGSFDTLEVRRAQLEIKGAARKLLIGTLESLKKREIVSWEMRYFLRTASGAVRAATPAEVVSIKRIEEKTMREHDATPFKLNMNPSLNEKYKKALREAYQEFGWQYVFTQIEVVGNKLDVIERYAEADTEKAIRSVRKHIREIAQKVIRDNCERDENKAEEQAGWVEGFNLGRMRAEAICYLIEELA